LNWEFISNSLTSPIILHADTLFWLYSVVLEKAILDEPTCIEALNAYGSLLFDVAQKLKTDGPSAKPERDRCVSGLRYLAIVFLLLPCRQETWEVKENKNACNMYAKLTHMHAQITYIQDI